MIFACDLVVYVSLLTHAFIAELYVLVQELIFTNVVGIVSVNLAVDLQEISLQFVLQIYFLFLLLQEIQHIIVCLLYSFLP